MTRRLAAPLILFGAFDRHNFGDLLFAHLAAAFVQPREVVFAGLAARDLSPYGGHRVQAIAALARDWGTVPADVLHVGGELFSCDLYEAAVMLLTPAEARAAIARYDAVPAEGLAWARSQLGLDQTVAYMVPKALFETPGRFAYLGVGGVDLPARSPALRAEVFDRLREADRVTVRDRVTAQHLAEAGIAAEVVPDPAELTAIYFGERIRRHAGQDEPARMQARFSQGYLAVQCAADFGDDATLAQLARQLGEASRASGLGLVLFRAGAAPWHDDLDTCRRLMRNLPGDKVALFESLNLWDICALLAQARGYCGSSLHGHIVAGAFGVPGVGLRPPGHDEAPGKLAAYAATWQTEAPDSVVDVTEVSEAIARCLAWDRGTQAEAARGRVEAARQAVSGLLSLWSLTGPDAPP